MANSPLAAVVLCAGKGTRMKSDRAKVLHSVLGLPLAAYPVRRALGLGAQPVVPVVGHQAQAVEASLRGLFPHAPLRFALQAEQRGTGHAVMAAREALAGFDGRILILYGDTPLLREETLRALVAAHEAGGGPLAMISTEAPTPMPYGRVLREGGRVVRIVEEKDATPEQRAVRELNAGIYSVDAGFLWRALAELKPQNVQGEYYLTDVVELAARHGEVATVRAEFAETAGVNDRVDLADCTRVLQARVNRALMRAGVTLVDPATAYIAEDAEVGQDSEVGPLVSIGPGCRVGPRVVIEQGCVLTRSRVGEGTHLKPYSVLEEADVGPACHVGPFSRLRPATELAEGVHIGNFVETKKARIGKGSKANHLTYLGDARIGAGVNVGAGTITCNYDGVQKHETVLGDGVFIGSDTQLVAPVTVGEGAYVGAGTTLTRSVPPGSLALSRAPQEVREGWAERKRARLKALEAKAGPKKP
ncbi:MAG: bifunctional UDP-N-acetylglucosamine diphosphorylase/glucosamine-1-phosphate N-acetyltransferase GlmU [Myxococcaceae bacterium]|nr:bifunctional UDP-N-acetylglucosamine diphosphorylase/glucosamine-1-phosphate N-acetyltransferase GlmU [Myxococcaceae bacterium]